MYWVYICLFVTGFDAVFGAVAIQLPAEKPEKFANEEGCYNPDLDKVLPYNVPYSPQDGTSCREYTCRNDNTTTIFTCGAIAVGKGCALVPGDKCLPYPKCCDSIQCNDIDNEPNQTE